MTFNKTDNLRVGRTRSIHRDNPPFLVEHHKTGVSVNIVLIAKILLQELLPLRLVLFQLCFPRLTVSIHRNADNLNTRIVSEILFPYKEFPHNGDRTRLPTRPNKTALPCRSENLETFPAIGALASVVLLFLNDRPVVSDEPARSSAGQ